MVLFQRRFPAHGREWLISHHYNHFLPFKCIIIFRNGYSFETSLLLSIFLGMFGADRFYLGYPAIGLFKMCTLGCMFIGKY